MGERSKDPVEFEAFDEDFASDDDIDVTGEKQPLLSKRRMIEDYLEQKRLSRQLGDYDSFDDKDLRV